MLGVDVSGVVLAGQDSVVVSTRVTMKSCPACDWLDGLFAIELWLDDWFPALFAIELCDCDGFALAALWLCSALLP